MATIRLSERKLCNIIKEALNKVFNENKSISEIKYFHPSGKTLPNGSFYQKGGFLRECNISRSTFTYCTIDNNCNLHLRKLNNDGEITDDIFLYSLNTGIGIAQQVYLLSKDNLNVEVVTDVTADGNVTKQTLASLLKGNVGNVILVKQQSGNSFYEN